MCVPISGRKRRDLALALTLAKDGRPKCIPLPRDAQRDHRLARISLSSGVVHSADLVAMMGRGCFPREEMNATKRDLEVLRCKVHLVAQPVGLDASVESGHSFASI